MIKLPEGVKIGFGILLACAIVCLAVYSPAANKAEAAAPSLVNARFVGRAKGCEIFEISDNRGSQYNPADDRRVYVIVGETQDDPISCGIQ